MADASPLVDVVIENGIGTLTLNDPGRSNCVSSAMSLAVEEAAHRLDGDRDVRVIVVTGAGRTFSAGGDLDNLANPQGDLATAYRGFIALGALATPVIAAVNGPAVGAGINFAVACDILIAKRSAWFSASFLDISIHPGGGILWRLNRLVGRQAAAAMVLAGERISADRAFDLGLVWSVVDDDAFQDEVLRIATQIAGRSPEVARRTKASLRASLPIMNERLAVDLEEIAQRWSMKRSEFLEAAGVLRDRIKSTGQK